MSDCVSTLKSPSPCPSPGLKAYVTARCSASRTQILAYPSPSLSRTISHNREDETIFSPSSSLRMPLQQSSAISSRRSTPLENLTKPHPRSRNMRLLSNLASPKIPQRRLLRLRSRHVSQRLPASAKSKIRVLLWFDTAVARQQQDTNAETIYH